MDKQEYLNQISASVRPAKPEKTGLSGILSSTIFRVAMVGVIGVILLAIVGSIIGGGKGSVKEELQELDLYIGSTMSVISDYQPNLKSSSLRSHSASLYSVLSNTSRDVNNYLVGAYGESEATASNTMAEDEKLHLDGLESELFSAKINGILDRIYAHKMAYEISMIMSREGSVYERVSDASLKTAIETSYNSLNNLYSEFEGFSETK